MAFHTNGFTMGFSILAAALKDIIPQPTPDSWAYYLDDSKYWKFSSPKSFANGDKLSLIFNTDVNMAGKYLFDGRDLGNTSFLIINGANGLDWDGGIASVKIDGKEIPKYTDFTFNDGKPHKLEVTFSSAVKLNGIGTSQWDSDWYEGYIYDFKIIKKGVTTYYNTLGNKDTGATQAPTTGRGSMTVRYYDPTKWKKLEGSTTAPSLRPSTNIPNKPIVPISKNDTWEDDSTWKDSGDWSE